MEGIEGGNYNKITEPKQEVTQEDISKWDKVSEYLNDFKDEDIDDLNELMDFGREDKEGLKIYEKKDGSYVKYFNNNTKMLPIKCDENGITIEHYKNELRNHILTKYGNNVELTENGKFVLQDDNGYYTYKVPELEFKNGILGANYKKNTMDDDKFYDLPTIKDMLDKKIKWAIDNLLDR